MTVSAYPTAQARILKVTVPSGVSSPALRYQHNQFPLLLMLANALLTAHKHSARRQFVTVGHPRYSHARVAFGILCFQIRVKRFKSGVVLLVMRGEKLAGFLSDVVQTFMFCRRTALFYAVPRALRHDDGSLCKLALRAPVKERQFRGQPDAQHCACDDAGGNCHADEAGVQRLVKLSPGMSLRKDVMVVL